MAESLTYPTSNENSANDEESADAVAAEDNQKELADLERRVAEADKNVTKIFNLVDLELKIHALSRPTSLPFDEDESDDEESADGVAVDPMLRMLTDLERKIAKTEKNTQKSVERNLTDLEIKIAKAEQNKEERLLWLGEGLKEQNSRLGRLGYPAASSSASLTRSQTLSNASKMLADLEIKIVEVEKNTEKLIELSKRHEQNCQLQYLADLSNASDLTRSSQTLGMVTAFGFAGFVAGILVGLLPNKRRS